MAWLRGVHRVFGVDPSILYLYNMEDPNLMTTQCAVSSSLSCPPSAPVENCANKARTDLLAVANRVNRGSCE